MQKSWDNISLEVLGRRADRNPLDSLQRIFVVRATTCRLDEHCDEKRCFTGKQKVGTFSSISLSYHSGRHCIQISSFLVGLGCRWWQTCWVWLYLGCLYYVYALWWAQNVWWEIRYYTVFSLLPAAAWTKGYLRIHFGRKYPALQMHIIYNKHSIGPVDFISVAIETRGWMDGWICSSIVSPY